VKHPYRPDEAAGGGLLEVFRPSDVTGNKRARPLLKERDELERGLGEKAAELARAEEALRVEIAKRESAEKAFRERRKITES
jgi:C4-dicarboxylate-specific signal transduction histidine kinase